MQSTARWHIPVQHWRFTIIAALLALGSVHAQTNYQQIKSFGWLSLAGGNPSGPLVEGDDGYLYGTTRGGALSYGSVFRIDRQGNHYRSIHQFSSTEGSPSGPLSKFKSGDLYGATTRGIFRLSAGGTTYSWVWELTQGLADPSSGVLEGTDGNLYLTTRLGGGQGGGTVIKVDRNGTTFAVLRAFNEMNSADSSRQPGGLVIGKDGNLYGITALGGPFINESLTTGGTVFKLSQDGNNYEILHAFGAQGDGVRPGSLIAGRDGLLYGATVNGGTSDWGTLFKLAPDGTGYTVLLSFGAAGVLGRNPNGLTEGLDGLLYGTVSATAFRVDKNGNGYTTLHEFFLDDQDFPTITAGSDGALYGATFSGGDQGYGTVYRLSPDGKDYRLLYSVLWSGGDASSPSTPLIEDRHNGRLYGVAPSGGTENAGVMFTLDKTGVTYSVLHNFSVRQGNGAHPSGLIQASNSVFYGTTWSGGASNLGTVFSLNGVGRDYTILHSFSGVDGSNPLDGVTEGKEGRLYGTTPSGGNFNRGVVFTVTENEPRFSVVWHFGGGASDGSPQATVIQGSDLALYGPSFSTNGGEIFRLDHLGLSILHRFDGDDAGLRPNARLTEASDGLLYGTASTIDRSKPGVIFSLQKSGSSYRVLHRFSFIDAAEVLSSLEEGPDGALYGTTAGGQANAAGGVFKIDKDGNSFQVLHNFDPAAGGGAEPQAGLTIGRDAALYGVTAKGGEMNLGTIFRLSTLPFPSRISAFEYRTSGMWLKLNGVGGQSYLIEAAGAGLTNWSQLGLTMASSEGLCQFIDQSAQNQQVRIYRARSE